MENHFWVIFDTCTRPEYYRDVHNIMSLPEGSVYQYNYQKKHIDKLALEYIGAYNYPQEILLIYGQYDEFEKGGDLGEYKKRGTTYFYIPTRMAVLMAVKTINDEVFLDFKLTGYPNSNDKNTLNKIYKSINGSNPFQNSKWISISDCLKDLQILKKGGNTQNWQCIVKEFQYNSQFRYDSFWRLEGPFCKGLRKIYGFQSFIKYNRHGENILHHYELYQGVGFFFNVFNHEPLGTIKQDRMKKQIADGKSIDSVIRKLIINSDSPIIKSNTKEISLRQYSATTITFQKCYSSEIVPQEAVCELSTNGQYDEWPIGPQYSLHFIIKKNPYLIFVAIVCLLLGTGLAVYAAHYNTTDIARAIKYSILSGLLYLCASVALYNQLKTSTTK